MLSPLVSPFPSLRASTSRLFAPLARLAGALLATSVALVVLSRPAAAVGQPIAGPSADSGVEQRPPLPLDPVLQPLTEERLFTEARVGVQVVDVATGDEVYSFQPDEPLVPASVTKVLTSAVALRTLGPAYRFHTDLLRAADATIDADGVLTGDLYVRGTGDPSLVVERLWKLVHDLKVEGVVDIDGDVVFDATWFDDEHLIPGWDKPLDAATGPAYYAPLGGLSVNFNTAGIVVAPGLDIGNPARVHLETPASAVELRNEAVTGKVGSRRWLRIERELLDRGDRVAFTVKGNVPMNAGTSRYYRAVGKPLPHFVSVFQSLLDQHGITVRGTLHAGVAPEDAELLVRSDSDPLGVLIGIMNKRSSNFMAEHVLKAIGAEVKGAPGTTAAGLSVVSDYLVGLGIPRDEFTLLNGSGLSRDAVLRPSHVNAVLLDMAHDRRVGPEFMASLAVGGVDGTLWRRFDDEAEVGRIRGKTGSLDGVFCLAGYADAGDGSFYAFTFFVNEIDGSSREARRTQDRFGELLLGLSGDAGAGGAAASDEDEADGG